MHFYESSMITTVDGLHCQVYSNEHPEGKVIVKPKYIPTEKVHSDVLDHRFISGMKMNRLNLWINSDALKRYIEDFSKAYPQYIFKSDMHEESPLFFAIPKESIERVYFPKSGLKQLMNMPKKGLDPHLASVVEFVTFLLGGGLTLEDVGITYSSLMGYYSPDLSDINIVIYGKEKFWKLMKFLEKSEHKDLRWKNYEEWEEFYQRRNRNSIHEKDIYVKNMHRKKSEGFFKDTLFVIFAVEEPDETWFKWGEEKYKKIGNAKFEAIIRDNKDSVVRPGRYGISDTKFIGGDLNCKDIQIKDFVFHSRDYCMFAYPGEKVEISGVVEEVTNKRGEKYHRLTIGYIDSYLTEGREDQYLRVLGVKNEEVSNLIREPSGNQENCNLCRETKFEIGEDTGYGKVIYKNGNPQNGWFATLSPKTGGNPNADFTIQLMPRAHLTHFSQMESYPGLSENYGIIFSKISKAMTEVMIEEGNLKADVEDKNLAVSVGTYGKSTTWSPKKEHLHLKIFPFRNAIGQPYTPDSSFGRKEILRDEKGEFVKMSPVTKKMIERERFEKLANRLVSLLN